MRYLTPFCAATLLLATSVSADTLNWNTLSVGYTKANIKLDAADFGNSKRFKPDGWQVQGSYLLTEQLYLRGRHDRVSGDLLNTGITLEQSWLSLGMRRQVTLGLDTFFEGGYAKSTSSTNTLFMDDIAIRFRDSGSGYQLGAGVRYLAKPELEFGVALRHINVSTEDSSSLAELSAAYSISAQLGLFTNLLVNSDGSMFAVGARFQF